jgi:hypothetical protein
MNYDYKLIPFRSMIALCGCANYPDAYVAEDAESNALRNLLTEGYRWIRTDADYAIFEKLLTTPPGESQV